ncbi:MAG: hypothetical protein PHW50_01410 [Patescibacteria group bacterium]|nr:hypothetical protein [Patescibacteria group bacterium]
MQEYLLVCLIPLQVDVPKVQKQIVSLVNNFKGKILLQENREQDLVFPIKKQTKVFLLKTFFTLGGNDMLKLKKDLDHESDILRFLMVKFPYTKVKSGHEAKLKRVERQAGAVKKKTGAAKTKSPKKKVIKKINKKVKAEKLDKALEKILKE